MTATDTKLFFPFERDAENPLHPPTVFSRLRRENPVPRVEVWNGTRPWLVTRYHDVRAVFTDPRFSSDPRPWPDFPEKSAAYGQTMGQDHNIRTMDNPEHRTHHRMLFVDFSRKRGEEIREHVGAVVDECLDRMLEAGPGVDVVTELARPVPTVVICELLGVPYSERDFFQNRAVIATSGQYSAEEGATAGRELSEFIDSILDDKIASPGNDLLSRLAAQMREGLLTRDEVVGYGRLMLIAGHETSASQIALSILALLKHPEQQALLSDSEVSPKLISNAVEELLRYLSISHSGQRRVAVEDAEIGDQPVSAGDGVILSIPSANYDDEVFENPETLDIQRANAHANVAFGYGIHQCIGQLLAKIELEEVYSRVFRRIPTLELDVDPAQLTYHSHDAANAGVDKLPVRWSS